MSQEDNITSSGNSERSKAFDRRLGGSSLLGGAAVAGILSLDAMSRQNYGTGGIVAIFTGVLVGTGAMLLGEARTLDDQATAMLSQPIAQNEAQTQIIE